MSSSHPIGSNSNDVDSSSPHPARHGRRSRQSRNRAQTTIGAVGVRRAPSGPNGEISGADIAWAMYVLLSPLITNVSWSALTSNQSLLACGLIIEAPNPSSLAGTEDMLSTDSSPTDSSATVNSTTGPSVPDKEESGASG